MSKIINETCSKCGKIYTFIVETPSYIRKKSLCWDHSWKVSDLEEMTPKELSNEDVIMISDINEKKSMKITIGDLIKYINKNK